MEIISVNRLSKEFKVPKRKLGAGAIRSFFFPNYEIRNALDNVSFGIGKGELVGYIGPNGAGKSTTIKILSGILVPTYGDVKVLGKTPWEHRIETVRQIGVVFGQRTQLWWDLPVIDSFRLLKDIYRVPEKHYKKTLDSLIDTFELSKICHVPVRNLSLGQRMRCDIAASLLHSPQILFLDEPTIGLDAVSKLAMRDYIRHLNKEHQITILLTTHDLDDIESLCARVLLLNEGSLFFDGSLNLLRNTLLPERRLIVDIQEENVIVSDPQAILIKKEGHRHLFKYNPTETSTPELIARITSKYSIRDLYVENPPIEEIIAQFYKNVNNFKPTG